MYKPLGFVAAGFLLLLGSASHAQEAPPTNDDGTRVNAIEEITVTARRRDESIQDVPIPVSAISADGLRDRVASDLGDLGRIVPNLGFNESITNSGTATVFLRGIGQVNWSPVQDPKVGIYLDGVYLARPQGGVFDILDLERIEVLRGPQGTLFGRNTTAGLVHVITKNPTDRFEGQVGFQIGNSGRLSGSAILNVPISSTLSTRFSLQHVESDGYVENRSTNTDWNDENSQIFRSTVLFTPNDKLEVALRFDYQRVREHSSLASCRWSGPPSSPALLAAPGAIPLLYIFNVYDEIAEACNDTTPFASDENDPNDESNLDGLGLNLTFDVNLSDHIGLTSIAAYRTTKGFNGSWGQATDKLGTPSYLEILGYDDDNYKQWSYEIRVSGEHTRLHWQAGAYLFKETGDSHLDVTLLRGVAPPDCATWPIWCAPLPAPLVAALNVPPNTTWGGFALGAQALGARRQLIEAENRSSALFGEVVFSITEQLSLTAGIRYNKDERDFTRTQTLVVGADYPGLACPPGITLVNGRTCRRSQNFTKVIPRAILSYQANDDFLLYGGWSLGYSSGGFNQDVAMRPYEPEVSGNWEAGIKSSWLNNRLTLNLTAFYNVYENQQITVGRFVNGQATADLINAQKAQLWGFEGELQWTTGNWFVGLSVGVLDGKYDEFTVLDNVTTVVGTGSMVVERDLKDTQAVRGSPYTVNVSLGRHWELDERSQITAQAGYSRRGRIFSTLETLDSSRQGAYGLMDARLNWTFKHDQGGRTVATLWATNLLNQRYFTGALDFSGGTAPLQYTSLYWGEPRRFGVSVAYQFFTL